MFLQDASDRFEIMCRDPRDLMLIQLETGAHGVVGNDWHARLDRFFLDNLGKFRKYDGKSVQDLMRALRNKVGFLSCTMLPLNLTTLDGIETPLPRPAGQRKAASGCHA